MVHNVFPKAGKRRVAAYVFIDLSILQLAHHCYQGFVFFFVGIGIDVFGQLQLLYVAGQVGVAVPFAFYNIDIKKRVFFFIEVENHRQVLCRYAFFFFFFGFYFHCYFFFAGQWCRLGSYTFNAAIEHA